MGAALPQARGPRSCRAAVGLMLVLLASVAVAVTAGVGTAAAHARMVASNPAEGDVLDAVPSQVSISFSETVQLPAGGLRVLGPDGRPVDDGSAGHAGDDGRTVRVGLESGSAQGSYTVTWRVVSADTHPVSGAFTFAVGHASTPSAVPGANGEDAAQRAVTALGVSYWVVRALGYLSLAGLVGAAALLLLCWPAGAGDRAARRVAATAWGASVVAAMATFLLQGPYGAGGGNPFNPSLLAETMRLRLGPALLVRLALLVGAAVYLRALLHRLRAHGNQQRWRLGVAGALLAVALAGTWAVSGHAAEGPQPLLAVPVDVVHLLAMAVWLGGLGVLAGALLPTRRPRTDGLAAAVARFSPIALGCVAVLAATGAYQTWRQLGSWSDFVSTDYGNVLLYKLLAVSGLVGVAAISRAAVRRRRSEPAAAPAPVLRWTLALEAAVGVVVLVVTALLVNTAPGRSAGAAASPQGPAELTVDYDTGGRGGSGDMRVRLDPAAPGPNTIHVVVRGPDGAPRTVPELTAAATLPDRDLGPLLLNLRRVGQGRYRGEGQLPLAGNYTLQLTIRTSPIDQITTRSTVTVR